MRVTASSNSVVARVGRVGLPESVAALSRRAWDVIVVGGGHNGLACAAYLARAGKSVLVLEAREQLGGACTLERPFPDQRYLASPCAYLLGLLDHRVIDELQLRARGLAYFVADPEVWIPYPDATSFTQWVDPARTRASMQALGISPSDVEGFFAYGKLYADIRRKLRKGTRDAWLDESPSRAEIEDLLDHDELMSDVVFRASVAEVLDDFMVSAKLKDALFAGGIIGTYAGPRDPGTASIKLMHRMGDLDGQGAVWAYVKGGMGVVSFVIADAAVDAGAVLAAGVRVAAVLPTEGVQLEDGTLIRAGTVVSNADPKVLLGLLPSESMPTAFRERLERWDVRSATVKFNAALTRLPSFLAAPGEQFMTRGTIDLTTGLDATQEAFEQCKLGLAAVSFGEVYFQTSHDPSVAPPGRHLISIFGQYAPYNLNGGWDAGRQGVARQFFDLFNQFAPDFEDCVDSYQILGPPDIEARVGLTGGNIFQGSVLPEQMWQNRFAARTDVPGVYLCGAATHPAGSVLGLNGRNAAMSVLADTLV